MRRRLALLIAFLVPVIAPAQTRSFTARELIAGVKAAKPSGGVYARLRMEHHGPTKETTVLQVQVKRRALPDGASESLLQLLFPRERKGEGLLVKIKGTSFSGATFTPGKGIRPLKPSDRDAQVFGTAFTIDDLTAGFLDWPVQEIVGKEPQGGVPCTVVELRPSKSSASKARCWIDEKRFATMRVEFFNSGDKPAKSVTTHKVMRNNSGYFAPVNFTVTDHASGAATSIEGVRSDDDVSYTDADFADSALQTVTAPGKGG
jgi:Outer membrane lipoprotein-sorting protein